MQGRAAKEKTVARLVLDQHALHSLCGAAEARPREFKRLCVCVRVPCCRTHQT